MYCEDKLLTGSFLIDNSSHNVHKETVLYVYNATILTIGQIPSIPTRTLPITSQQVQYQKPKVSPYSRNIIRFHLRNKSSQWNTQLICFPLSSKKHASVLFKIYSYVYISYHISYFYNLV